MNCKRYKLYYTYINIILSDEIHTSKDIKLTQINFSKGLALPDGFYMRAFVTSFSHCRSVAVGTMFTEFEI